MVGFSKELSSHSPTRKPWDFFNKDSFVICSIICSSPIANELVSDTDYVFSVKGKIVCQSLTTTVCTNRNSTQLVELEIFIYLLSHVTGPCSTISNSAYVFCLYSWNCHCFHKCLQHCGVIFTLTTAKYLQNRCKPVFITHIRSHSSISGSIVLGN